LILEYYLHERITDTIQQDNLSLDLEVPIAYNMNIYF
jgi:hypothetical protein